VDDAADLGEFAIEEGVGVEVAGGAEGTVDYFAVEVGDHQVGGGEAGVVDATGLDDDERLTARTVHARPVYATGVSKGMWGEAAARNLAVGFQDLIAK